MGKAFINPVQAAALAFIITSFGLTFVMEIRLPTIQDEAPTTKFVLDMLTLALFSATIHNGMGLHDKLYEVEQLDQ
jgi:hypothetical protein